MKRVLRIRRNKPEQIETNERTIYNQGYLKGREDGVTYYAKEMSKLHSQIIELQKRVKSDSRTETSPAAPHDVMYHRDREDMADEVINRMRDVTQYHIDDGTYREERTHTVQTMGLPDEEVTYGGVLNNGSATRNMGMADEVVNRMRDATQAHIDAQTGIEHAPIQSGEPVEAQVEGHNRSLRARLRRAFRG